MNTGRQVARHARVGVTVRLRKIPDVAVLPHRKTLAIQRLLVPIVEILPRLLRLVEIAAGDEVDGSS